jgi:hypothetical protein
MKKVHDLQTHFSKEFRPFLKLRFPSISSVPISWQWRLENFSLVEFILRAEGIKK